MIEGPIKQDEEFRHSRDGTVYIVLHGNDVPQKVLMKTGPTGTPGEGWHPAIAYYSAHDADTLFVRDEATFRVNFERA